MFVFLNMPFVAEWCNFPYRLFHRLLIFLQLFLQRLKHTHTHTCTYTLGKLILHSRKEIERKAKKGRTSSRENRKVTLRSPLNRRATKCGVGHRQPVRKPVKSSDKVQRNTCMQIHESQKRVTRADNDRRSLLFVLGRRCRPSLICFGHAFSTSTDRPLSSLYCEITISYDSFC